MPTATGFSAPLEGLRDVSTRWVVTHDIAEWKDEIAWMSLYFSVAVWASLALCVVLFARKSSAALSRRSGHREHGGEPGGRSWQHPLSMNAGDCRPQTVNLEITA